MAFQGRLSSVPIAELLEWIQVSTRTGSLELENERFRKRVWFADGTIVAVESTEPADALTGKLHARGVLNDAQARAAAQVHDRTGRPIAEILHSTGAVAGDDLERALEEHARDALLAVFLWRDGSFAFRDGGIPCEIPAAVAVEPLSLLAEGTALARRAAELRERLGAEDGRFVLAAGHAEAASGSPAVAAIRRLLATPQTVYSLMMEVGSPEHEVLEVLAALEARGVLRRTEGAVPAGAVASPVRAVREGGSEDDLHSTVAIGVAEAPAATPGRALELLAQARAAMDRKSYERAVELFRAAERADPGDPRLAMLRHSAEGVWVEVLEREELPPQRTPRPSNAATGVLSAAAARMLARVDGRRTVAELARGAGVEPVEAMGALLELKRAGRIELPFD